MAVEDDMTPEDRAARDELFVILNNAATPGPWTANASGLNHPAWVCYADRERAKIEHAGHTGALIWAADEDDQREDPNRDVRFRGGEADEKLIAFCRNNFEAVLAERDDCKADYIRRHRDACDCLEREVMLIAELARWKTDCDDTATCLANERKRFAELLQEVHNERDAAMRVVEAAIRMRDDATDTLGPTNALWDALDSLDARKS